MLSCRCSGTRTRYYGSALTLAATIQTWAAGTDTPVLDLVRAAVR
jgi:hypothetical protein